MICVALRPGGRFEWKNHFTDPVTVEGVGQLTATPPSNLFTLVSAYHSNNAV